MNNIYILYALDQTTEFLSVFKDHFPDKLFVIKPNAESVKESLSFLEQVPEQSLIVFLGHGHSTGLYTPESESFEKKIFIDSDYSNVVFKNKIAILLTCNSSQFIKNFTSYKYIVGFGNIISSMHEAIAESEFETWRLGKISENDIEYFNNAYCNAVILSLTSYQKGNCNYTDLPKLIKYFINQSINEILSNKEIKNRVERARLLYEFRNEMVYY
jgi:hypothetical protein